MQRILASLFKIQPGESQKVLLFGLVAGLIEFGLALGLTAGDSLFLHYAGAENLSIIYFSSPVLLIIYTLIYSWLIRHLGLIQTFKITLVVLAIGGIALWFSVQQFVHGDSVFATPIIYAVKYYGVLWTIALFTLLWGFIDSYFQIQDAKRLFPLFAAAASLGGTLGGTAAFGLSSFIPVEIYFLVWAVSALATLPVIQHIAKNMRLLSIEDEQADDDGDTNILQILIAVIRSVRSSKYASVLGLLLFISMFTATLMEYQSLEIFSKDRDEQSLASLIGSMYAAANLFNLVFALFLFNRLVMAIGVRNTALVLPICQIAVFLYFLFDYGFASAVLSFMVFHGVMVSIAENNNNLLFNGLPSASKQQIRTIVEGLAEPLATAIVGALLLIFVNSWGSDTFSTIGLSMAIVALLLVMILRSTYVSAIVENLKKGWMDLKQVDLNILTRSKDAELRQLYDKASSGKLHEKIDAISILHYSRPDDAMQQAQKLLQTKDREDLAAGCDLITRFMARDANRTYLNLMEWLSMDSRNQSYLLTESLAAHRLFSLAYLKSLSNELPTHKMGPVIVGLWNSWHVEDTQLSLEKIREMLSSKSLEAKVSALHAIGYLNHGNFIHMLVPFAQSTVVEEKKAALAAIARLANPESTRVLPCLFSIIDEGQPKYTTLALSAIRKIGDTASVPEVLKRARLFTATEQKLSSELILSIGLQTVPILVKILNESQYSIQARILSARCLSELAIPQLETRANSLIEESLIAALVCSRNASLIEEYASRGPGHRVLYRHYKDSPRNSVTFILEVLHRIGRLPDFDLVQSSLESNNPKDKANALETVEQSVGRKWFPLIEMLATSAPPKDAFEWGLKKGLIEETTYDLLIEEASQSSDPIESASALQACFEIDPDSAVPHISKSAIQERSLVFRQTAGLLLQKVASREGDKTHRDPTLVEQLDWIFAHPFFDGLTIMDVEILLEKSELIELGPSRTLKLSESHSRGIFLLYEGELRNWSSERIEHGTLLGTSSILSETADESYYTTDQPAFFLQIPYESFNRCVSISPRVATALFRTKLRFDNIR
jgi:hypothetical protein